MYDHLNDPDPHLDTGQGRAAVTARVAELRRRRQAVLGGGGTLAVFAAAGVAAAMLLPTGDERLSVAATASPGVSRSALASPTPATPSPVPSSPSAAPSLSPTTRPGPTVAPPTLDPPESRAGEAATFDQPRLPTPPAGYRSGCEVPDLPTSMSAPKSGWTVSFELKTTTTRVGLSGHGLLTVTNGAGVGGTFISQWHPLYYLVDENGRQAAKVSTPIYDWREWSLLPGQRQSLDEITLFPSDGCPPDRDSSYLEPGRYTVIAGLRVVNPDGSFSVWLAPQRPVFTFTAAPAATPSAG